MPIPRQVHVNTKKKNKLDRGSGIKLSKTPLIDDRVKIEISTIRRHLIKYDITKFKNENIHCDDTKVTRTLSSI